MSGNSSSIRNYYKRLQDALDAVRQDSDDDAEYH